MSDERDHNDDPAEQFKQGIGLLWRAARGAAATMKKEMDRSDFGRSLEDAGRELARAAGNVASRISSELGKHSERPWERPRERPASQARPDAPEGEADEFDGVKAPRREGSSSDPGFRITTDDDE